MTDTELLDYLESLVAGYGQGLIVRTEASRDRGFVIHETSRPDLHGVPQAQKTVRAAIRYHMERSKEGVVV